MKICHTHKAIYIALFTLFFFSCNKDDENGGPDITPYQESVIAYFEEIALGFEFGNSSEITRKWGGEMKIFVGGEASSELLEELDQIILEINELASDGFQMRVTNDTLDSNFYIFLGSGDAYGNIFPGSRNLIETNWGLFNINWNGANFLVNGRMYVDTERAGLDAQKHLLREELTQSLGLAKDSFKYPESIFQQNWTTTTTYAPIDKELIKLLYHPNMKPGLSGTTLKVLLINILIETS